MRALMAAMLLVPAAAAAPPATWLLVISGIGGDPEHGAAFVQLAERLVEAAESRGVEAERIVYLAESADSSQRARDRASREVITATLAELGQRSAPGDDLVIVLLGHGNARGSESYFNLPGPDISGTDLAGALEPLSGRRVAVVNTAAASGGFVEALAAPGRVVITATRGARELLEPTFARYFVEAFAEAAGDLDKDGRTSLLEAFRHANQQVERLYETEGRLRTEHAQLDDDGDGAASESPDGEDEGALAARIALAGSAFPAIDSTDPEIAALMERRRAAEQELAELRQRQGAMSAAEYDAALEEILVRIAEIDAAIRARGGQR